MSPDFFQQTQSNHKNTRTMSQYKQVLILIVITLLFALVTNILIVVL